MGVVRKQSIQSSLFMYVGFAVGAFNFWLLPHILTTEQFGLVRLMISICSILAMACSLGTQNVITRFYPYFDDQGKKHKTDLLTWTFLISLGGFVLLVVATLFFKEFIIRKFQGNAALFLDYFYLIYPFTLFILLFNMLEKVARSRQFAVQASFLRETGVRVFTSLIVIALALHWLGFTGFVTLYSFQFAAASIILAYFLFIKKNTGFDFKVSRTTQRLYKQMAVYSLFIFGGSIFRIIEPYLNTILLGSRVNLSTAGVFDIAFFIATLILVPKRSMQGAAIATIARAWKERDLKRIERIYKKSAATLLIAGLFIFGLIWLNLDDVFKLYKPEYSAGKYVVLFVGLANLTEMAFGLNRDILVNSKIWRLDFILNVILIAVFILVTYIMVVRYGMMGSAYSVLISLTFYNVMRFLLIWWKYKIQPFSRKTVFILLGALLAYVIVVLLFPVNDMLFFNMALRSLLFVLIFGAIIFFGKLSEDIIELWESAKQRWLN